MRIVVLPGDDIGPEIARATVAALEAADRRYRLGLALEAMEIGKASLAREGTTLPDAVIAAVEAADGFVMGPVDTVSYPPAAEGGINPSATMRKRLDLFANIRPAKTPPGVATIGGQMDLVIVRENTEGFYADRTMAVGSGEFMPTPDLALAVRKITRQASERVGEAACRLAATRRGRLAVVHKGNVLKLSDGLFREGVMAAARRHPAVAVEEVLVDAMASLLVRDPGQFDVIVTTNMFGDILSNEAAELSGGLGLAGSLNAGERYAMAQAAHGSAPDIAGQGVANPAALIRSAAMLVAWLGERHQRSDLKTAAAAMETALDGQLAEGRTRDLGGSLSTASFAAGVAERIAAG